MTDLTPLLLPIPNIAFFSFGVFVDQVSVYPLGRKEWEGDVNRKGGWR